jgi:iron-sulfur cluster assembly protein/iron-sulfur cluster insertion protein
MTTATAVQISRRPEVVQLTPAAATKVSVLLAAESNPELALRLSVRPGGCSGFSYEMYFDTEIDPTDTISDQQGIKVVVDPASALLLRGATLDYTDSLNDSGFHFSNPNSTRTCGCGSSFS